MERRFLDANNSHYFTKDGTVSQTDQQQKVGAKSE